MEACTADNTNAIELSCEKFETGLKKEEKRLKQEEEKEKDPFQKGEQRKIRVPRYLRYPMVQEHVARKPEDQTKGSQDPGDIIANVRMMGKGEAERFWKKQGP